MFRRVYLIPQPPVYPRRLEDATRHMSGWRKAKKLTAAASATRALTEMLPNLDDSQKHWVAFAVHLSLPMGLGFDHNHRVSEIKPTGSGFADGQVQVGDWLTHFDGVDLRQSGQSIMDVLDRSRQSHSLVLQRMMVHARHREGWTTLTVRIVPIEGTMGIGLDAGHTVTALYRGGAAERDGRLQVGDLLLAMDGVDITEGVSLVDVLDPQRSPHQLIICRRNELVEYAKAAGAATEVVQFEVQCPTLLGEDGRRRMGISLTTQNVVTELDPKHLANAAGEIAVGDRILSVNGVDVAGGRLPVAEAVRNGPALEVHRLLVARVVPLRP